MNEKKQKIVKETINKLLDVMGMEAIIEEERIEDLGDDKEILMINLEVDNPNLLIGQYGSNLQSLQHLAALIVKKNITNGKKDFSEEDEVRFDIDVNDYKKQKRESLVKLAETMANQVAFSKNSVALRPMSSYERKIIHTEIAKRKDLATESIGEDLMRRVIIKYVGVEEE